jgi:Subtilase family
MRTGLAILAALSVLTACATSPRASDPSRSDASLNVASDRLIIVTVDNGTRLLIGEPGSTPHGYSATSSYSVSDQARDVTVVLAHDYGLRKVREWPIAPLKVQCLVFAVPENADREALIARLSADRRVKLAQPLQLFNALGDTLSGRGNHTAATGVEAPGASIAALYNDPYFELQHGFTEVDAAAAQQWSRGEGVSVAIIDTGVATAHPDLDGRIAVTRNFIDADMKAFQSDRHGTEVAGIIGADANNGVGIVGIAPAVRLQVYKACEPSHPGSMEAVCNSFTLARALGAAIDARAQIVNLSLGGPADPLLTQLISYGEQRGVIFVGAVPENGQLDGFPIAITGVIAVDVAGRSVNVSGVLHAPGRDIVSTAPGGSYDFASGSSFAAAHVTGAIALLRARVPALTSDSLRAVLDRTGAREIDGNTINICAALDAVQPRDDCMHSARAVATAAAAH